MAEPPRDYKQKWRVQQLLLSSSSMVHFIHNYGPQSHQKRSKKMILFRLIILLVPQSKLFIITTDDLPAELRDFGSVEK
jgi:hypothetical protein